MSNPFQEQFLKAGLASSQQVKKARADQRKGKKKQGQPGEAEEIRLAAERTRAEKANADREREQARQKARHQKELLAQIRQLIDSHRQAHDKGEIAYNFAWDGKVKTLRVSAEQQRRLAKGSLAIAVMGEQFTLIDADGAEKIRERDPAHLAVYNRPDSSQDGQSQGGDEDDPYAEFQVPDDLVW